MAFLGDLLIRLKAETADFQQDMGQAARSSERAIRQIQSAAIALGGSISVGVFVNMVKGAIDAGDQLNKLSQKVGVSVEELSKLKLAAELGDVDLATFGKGMRDFNRSLVESGDSSSKVAKLFKALGVDTLAGPAEAFRQFADAFAQLPEGELRTAAAMEILKKSGAEWIPVLAKGTKGLDDAADKAERLGLVISKEMAEQSEQFNDNMKLLEKGTAALGKSIAVQTLPALIEMTDSLIRAREAGQGFWGVINEGAKVLVATLGQIPGLNGFMEREFEKLYRAGRGLRPGEVQGKIGGLAPTPPAVPKVDPNAVRRALASNATKEAAELKLFTTAMQGLEKEYFNLTGSGKQVLLQYETEKGTLRELTPEHKKALLVMAARIDAYNLVIAQQKASTEAWSNEAKAIEDTRSALEEYGKQLRLDNEELGFQVSLVGKTSKEQEILNAQRQIDLEARRRVAALPAEDPYGNGAEAVLRINASAEKQKAIARDLIEERIALERAWSTGATSAVNDYMDVVASAAAQSRTLFTDAFKGMEDALVQFVKTGKLSFSSLADSIITDLIRIQIQNSITKPLAAASGQFLGQLFGGGGSMYSQPLFGEKIDYGQFFADGGNPRPNSWAVVGERGPELAYFGAGGGTVVPNDQLGGATYYIDAKGADPAAIGRLERTIQALNGSIERRALTVVADQARRGGTFGASLGK